MKDTNRATAFSARFVTAIGSLLLTGLLLAAPASAGFEQVGVFAESGESAQLAESKDVAVNTTGAGGVPAGTVYAVSGTGFGEGRVAVYSAKGEFRQAWGWDVSVEGKKEFERCGPDGEAAHPQCNKSGGNVDYEGIGDLNNPVGVTVDQATGDVYVLNEPYLSTGQPGLRIHNLIQVFSPDGSQLIASFLDAGKQGSEPPEGETVEEGPEKLHSLSPGGIAVDSAGTLYVSDYVADGKVKRIMTFRPQSPGDYEHYVYAGRASDIPASGGLDLDNAGNLYVSGGEFINELAVGDFGAPSCEYELAGGGIQALTVDPASGEVFYFNQKDKKIHQLSACGEGGEFEQTGVLAVTPKTSYIHGLAFNPALAWEASRPPGILYAVDSEKTGIGVTPKREGSLDVFAAAEVHFPEVKSEEVSAVTSTTALLGAQVNPKGFTTHYRFQYETEEAYEANEPAERFAGASEAPLGGADLPAAQEGLGAAASLVGLTPETGYRFRVIAASSCEAEHPGELCEVSGEAKAFRTFPLEAPGLSDRRAWELVSPALKNGGEVFPLEPETGSSVKCGLSGNGCKPGTIAPKYPRQSSPDGEAVVYEGFPFSADEGTANLNEYASRRTPGGWQTTTIAPALMSRAGYQGFDPSLSQGVISQGGTEPSLAPGAPFGYANLYAQPTSDPATLRPLLESEPPNRTGGGGASTLSLRYAGSSDDFSRLFFYANDALTPETPFAPEALDGGVNKYNLYEFHEGQLALVNVMPGNAETEPGAGFGGRFVEPGELTSAISTDGSHVFWSDEAGQVYARIGATSTVVIPDPGKYLTAADDGSRVLLSDGHLYDLQTEQTTDLTQGQGGFNSIAGHSGDLSRIYFIDTAVLAGENGEGRSPVQGKGNLYAWHDGETSFLAATGSSGQLVVADAEASQDGRWLAFISGLPLTGYDNFGTRCSLDVTHGQPFKYVPGNCQEAFLYDSAAGRLICASCNPSGAGPLGTTRLPVASGSASFPPPRYLTDSGRLYFDSQDSIVPADTNDGVEDVYQWEPEGVGSCKSTFAEGGCVSLISAGRGTEDSNFLSAGESGRDVFFTSRDELTLKDADELIDVYDAREGGGIASETETSRAECQGEACQPAISAPNDPTPGSSSFEGAGNVVEPKAAKKHHKKKHAKKHRSKHAHKRAANHNRGGAK